MTIAKKINQKLKLPNDDLLLGSIVPDALKVSTLSAEEDGSNPQLIKYKQISHFLADSLTNPNIPDLEKFLSEYKDKLTNPFIMGYYIHLYTDKLWFEDFIPRYMSPDQVKLLTGEIIDVTPQARIKLIYNDYDYFNKYLIRKYQLDLKFMNKNYCTYQTDLPFLNGDTINKFNQKIQKFILADVDFNNQIFSEKDLTEFIEESSETILNNILQLKN